MIERLLVEITRSLHNLMSTIQQLCSYGCVTDDFALHNLRVQELTFEKNLPVRLSNSAYSNRLYIVQQVFVLVRFGTLAHKMIVGLHASKLFNLDYTITQGREKCTHTQTFNHVEISSKRIKVKKLAVTIKER